MQIRMPFVFLSKESAKMSAMMLLFNFGMEVAECILGQYMFYRNLLHLVKEAGSRLSYQEIVSR